MSADKHDGGNEARLKKARLNGLLGELEQDHVGSPRDPSKDSRSRGLRFIQLENGSSAAHSGVKERRLTQMKPSMGAQVYCTPRTSIDLRLPRKEW